MSKVVESQWVFDGELSNVSANVYFAVSDSDYFKVVVKGKSKFFKGESAWSDAQRYAWDVYSNALYGGE